MLLIFFLAEQAQDQIEYEIGRPGIALRRLRDQTFDHSTLLADRAPGAVFPDQD